MRICSPGTPQRSHTDQGLKLVNSRYRERAEPGLSTASALVAPGENLQTCVFHFTTDTHPGTLILCHEVVGRLILKTRPTSKRDPEPRLGWVVPIMRFSGSSG